MSFHLQVMRPIFESSFTPFASFASFTPSIPFAPFTPCTPARATQSDAYRLFNAVERELGFFGVQSSQYLQPSRHGVQYIRQVRRRVGVDVARLVPRLPEVSCKVLETEGEYRIEADVASYPKEAIEIEFRDGKTIMISGSVETSHQAAQAAQQPAQQAEQRADQQAEQRADQQAEQRADQQADQSVAGAETTEPTTKANATTIEDVKDETDGTDETDKTNKINKMDGVNDAAKGQVTTTNDASDTNHATLTSQSAQSTQALDKKSVTRERMQRTQRSSFTRTFTVPGEVDQSAVRASLEDGLLSIVLPKKVEQAARRITIV